VSKDGDCAFVYLRSDPCYAERVDHVLTIYRSHKTDRIVGVEIKGISALPPHDGLGVHIEDDGDIEVVALILGIRLANPPPTTPILPDSALTAATGYSEAMRAFGDRRVRWADLVTHEGLPAASDSN
jgi:hypothetical protein